MVIPTRVFPLGWVCLYFFIYLFIFNLEALRIPDLYIICFNVSTFSKSLVFKYTV